MDSHNLNIILMAVLGVSEALSLIPQVKSSGFFQLVYNLLKAAITQDKSVI